MVMLMMSTVQLVFSMIYVLLIILVKIMESVYFKHLLIIMFAIAPTLVTLVVTVQVQTVHKLKCSDDVISCSLYVKLQQWLPW